MWLFSSCGHECGSEERMVERVERVAERGKMRDGGGGVRRKGKKAIGSVAKCKIHSVEC